MLVLVKAADVGEVKVKSVSMGGRMDARAACLVAGTQDSGAGHCETGNQARS